MIIASNLLSLWAVKLLSLQYLELAVTVCFQPIYIHGDVGAPSMRQNCSDFSLQISVTTYLP
jgi:hypothetical protein